jgi:sugar/nucleoside kinase (ribokinase family)
VEPSFLTKLFEVCYLENNQEMPKDLEDKIYHYLKLNLGKFDLVLVTDFGHGLITKRIVEILSREAAFLAVNVQTNSANLGFNLITKFPRADYVCIDEEEIRLACHDRVSELKDLILEVSRLLKCKKIIITRGHRGSLAYSKAEGFKAVPVFSTQILDRVGAGDAFFSLTSPCVFSGASMEASGFIGNAVGATKVLIVGNRSSVEPVPLFKYIATMLK